MEYKITRLSDDELMHYGVLGMKWGVRKHRPTSSIISKKRKKSIERNKLGEKKYNLSRKQKRYMSENGILTKYGIDKLMPIGYDLGKKRYKNKAGNEIRKYSSSWNKYIKEYRKNGNKDSEKSLELYKIFKKDEKELFDALYKIDYEYARDYVLKMKNGG